MEKTLLSMAVMGGLAALLGIILSAAYSKLKVEEDPGVEKITELLPGVNCGACGFASCEEFARQLVRKETDIEKCRITFRNKEVVMKIKNLTP